MNKLLLPIVTALVLATVLLAVPLYIIGPQIARSGGEEDLPPTSIDQPKNQFGAQLESAPTSDLSNYSNILYMVALSVVIAVITTSLIVRVQRRAFK